MPRLPRVSSLLLLLALGPSALAQSYCITDLGTLGPPGADASSATGINEIGQVVGYLATGLPVPPGQRNQHAFLWLPEPAGGFDAGLHDLGVLAGATSSSFGWSVNSHLRVAGSSENGEQGPFGSLVSRAALWVEGVPTDLGNPSPGFFYSIAESINEHDEMVGLEANGFVCKPLLWLPQPAYGLPAGVNILTVLPGHFDGEANDINDAGEIVGRSTGACDTSSGHAVLWLPQPAYGLPAGLHDLSPDIPSNRFAEAVAISGNGKVAGTLTFATADNVFLQPFFWESGALSRIPLFPDTTRGYGADVNAAGQVVGGMYGPNQVARPFLWQNGVLRDLHELLPPGLGWVLTGASGINDRGQIVGLGLKDGLSRSFLLEPDLLFADGFESGDTSAWSQTSP